MFLPPPHKKMFEGFYADIYYEQFGIKFDRLP